MGNESMIQELAGVPRAALRRVFGKALGQRIWEEAREVARSGDGSHRGPSSRAASDASNGVGDAEIVEGMISHLAREAEQTLRNRKRQAAAIALRLTYGNDEARLSRSNLARPSNDASEIAAAAMDLWLQEGRRSPVEAVQLLITSILTEPASESPRELCHAIPGAAGAQA
jgi:nucleotidyltransferase/DNA polymerase involved in DNA repair